MFKNLQLYRLPHDWGMTADRLSSQLSRASFQPCGSLDIQTTGWTSPVGHATHELVHSVSGQWLIALRIQQRLLPASVIKQAAEDRAEEIEAQQGCKPGRKQMKEIKDAVITELLPRAFTRDKLIHAWIDPTNGYLGINAPSKSAAEPVVEYLHRALDELPLLLVNTEISPASAMTDWLSGSEAPGEFSIDEDCELRAIDDEASAVRYVHHSLEGKEIREHIASGKQVSKLGLTFDGRIAFMLTDRLELKRIETLDGLSDEAEGTEEARGQEEKFDADFLLITAEFAKLIPALFEALGGEVNMHAGDLVEQAKEAA